MTGIADRAALLLSAVADEGQRGVVAYSSARHFLAEADPVWWLTRFKPLGECLALVAPDGAVELIVTPGWDRARAAESTDGLAIRTGDPLELAADWLRRAGLAPGGLALCGMRKASAERCGELASALGPLADADAAFDDAARRRDADDIAAAEEAAALATEGFHELLRILRPGLAEYEVITELHLRLRDLGAEDTFLLMSSGPHNLALHPPTERILAPGDIVLAEISPAVRGCYSQICRTVVLGPAPQRVRTDFELLSGALAAGAAACRDGTTVAEIVAAMDSVISDGGYADYCKPPHMRARGHGLGLGSAMPGDLTRVSKQQVVAGDVFVLHPNQYLPDSGYLLCGEPLAVTASEGVPLSGCFAPLAEVY